MTTSRCASRYAARLADAGQIDCVDPGRRPMLARIAERFGSRLHASAAELLEVGRHAHVDVPLASRHVERQRCGGHSDARAFARQHVLPGRWPDHIERALAGLSTGLANR